MLVFEDSRMHVCAPADRAFENVRLCGGTNSEKPVAVNYFFTNIKDIKVLGTVLEVFILFSTRFLLYFPVT